MTIQVPVDETLEQLSHGDNWTQGAWETGDGRMCLHQGIRQCEYHKGDAYLIEQVAEQQGWGAAFNDRDETTFDDVKQRLVEHREILPDELEMVFGPQWLHIVALVRRAAVLTDEEAEALNAAWDATRDAAWDAAWAAARAAHAAWDAAWAAAGAAAWAAARDAAWALSIRHLISETGFPQTHYDTLTRPWATVIGPVHPDDGTP